MIEVTPYALTRLIMWTPQNRNGTVEAEAFGYPIAYVESLTSDPDYRFLRMARPLGLSAYLLTADPGQYGQEDELAAHVVRLDTSDLKEILEWCKPLRRSGDLLGIFSSRESHVDIAAKAARELGLPGPNPEPVEKSRSKGFQLQALGLGGVPVPQFGIAYTKDEAVKVADQIGYPVVTKPDMGSGGRGVRWSENSSDLERALREIGSSAGRTCKDAVQGPLPPLVIEKFVDGPQYSAEAFDGTVVSITENFIGSLPEFVQVGHLSPARLDDSRSQQVQNTIQSCLSILGLDWGPAHVEFRIDSEGIKIIEVNRRAAGGQIPLLLRLATGIDLITQTLLRTIGEPTEDASPKWRRYAAIRFITACGDGEISDISGLSSARRHQRVVEARIYRRRGDAVRRHGDYRCRIGHVVACGDDPDAVLNAVNQAHTEIHVGIAPSQGGTVS
jgi:biotin carboxylase